MLLLRVIVDVTEGNSVLRVIRLDSDSPSRPAPSSAIAPGLLLMLQSTFKIHLRSPPPTVTVEEVEKADELTGGTSSETFAQIQTKLPPPTRQNKSLLIKKKFGNNKKSGNLLKNTKWFHEIVR